MAFSTINKSSLYQNQVLYTGTGSEQAITGVGFQPDMVWQKGRSTGTSPSIHDAVRGSTWEIYTSNTSADANYAQTCKSFDSDGFTVGTDGGWNGSGQTKVGWCWKANGSGSANTDGNVTTTVSANTTPGFSILKFTGTDTGGQTIGHGLGKKPRLYITKNCSEADNWMCWFDTTGNGTSDKRLILNSGNADYGNYPCTFNTDTITLPATSDNAWNGTGDTIIGYCFAEISGFSKFGSYVGNNGGSDGVFVYTGFKPQFVMIKLSSHTGANWNIRDTKRDTYNPMDNVLRANLNDAETDMADIDYLSNGFKTRANGLNQQDNGYTYSYMAFGQTLVGTNNIPATAR